MKYTIEFTSHPDHLHDCEPEAVARALTSIINSDLGFFWGSKVTVTPERTSAS